MNTTKSFVHDPHTAISDEEIFLEAFLVIIKLKLFIYMYE